VTIVLNKNITQAEGYRIYEVVPGHALMIEVSWHANESLSILAVYAPSQNMTENANFWQSIHTFFENNRRLKKPQIMLGDFNMVEDIIDRIPMRADPDAATNAFDDLKLSLQMMDGWRQTYRTTTAFTFLRKYNGHQARLDRIYVKPSIF
jgi:exonuclease III